MIEIFTLILQCYVFDLYTVNYRQLTSEKIKLYDDYKDGRMDRDLYKQRAEKISVQLDEIKQKIEAA